MIDRIWNGYRLTTEDASLFPVDSVEVSAEAVQEQEPAQMPRLFLVKRDPFTSRGVYAVSSYEEIEQETNVTALCGDMSKEQSPCARVVNMAFPGALDYVRNYDAFRREPRPLVATLVGLGDVGGTVLTGLKLLGTEFSEIRIFDPNESACKRYEIEMNQVLAVENDKALPKVTICSPDRLFDCDVFLFTASRGVPGLGTDVKDVRMAQFDANRKMLDTYAKQARDHGFQGLFCQISDPVDHLAREVFLASNRQEDGTYDFRGLLPEQVQGFGLGVMAARAAYYATEQERPVVYGPHGRGLIVANAGGDAYEEARSLELTRLTTQANLRVRDLGYKPYIAPGLSSAAVSILRMVRGLSHHGAVPLDGAYFGCRSRFTELGLFYEKEEICAPLLERIKESHKNLKEFPYDA